MSGSTDGIVNIDFLTDWKTIQYEWLTSRGFECNPTDDGIEISLKYFNVQKRWIPARPRRVHIPDNFMPPPSLEATIYTFIQDAEIGADLNPHQSKKIVDSDSRDMLLYDWRVIHFHLGEKNSSSYFVERTDLLLFALVTDDSVYLIDILPHGQWTQRHLLKVIQSNWPNLMSGYCIGIGELEQEVSDEDIAIMRAAGISTFTKLEDGSIYMSPGGGYTTSRHSTDVVRDSMHFRHCIKIMQDSLLNNITHLRNVNNLAPNRALAFKLKWMNNVFSALEENLGLVIEFYLNSQGTYNISSKRC